MAEVLLPQVSVLVSDIEILRAALNSAYHYSLAVDLADQYKKLSNRQQYSAMTKALEGSLNKIDAILNAAEDPNE